MDLTRRLALAVGLPARLILLGLLLIASCAPLAPAPTPSTPSPSTAPVTLAAVFAPWYGYDPLTGNCQGGLGSYRWDNDPNMAGVVDTPELGY